MPVEDGEYIQQSENDIRDALASELRSEFGNDIDLTESSVFNTLTQVLAAVLSANQEQSLQEVYQSAFLETATGEDLENVVALLGLQRRSAVHATGVQQFSAGGKVTTDYTIPRGHQVQTGGTDPTTFETTTTAVLEFVDSFEDGSLSEYGGDIANASIVTGNAYLGDNSLELDATSGAHVYYDNVGLEQGTTYHAHVRPRTSTVPIATFHVQDGTEGDHYHVAFDEAADEVRLELVSGGTVSSTLDSVSQSLTAGNYYEAEIRHNVTNAISVAVKDANGDELATLGATDSTYERGKVGFKSGDANAAKNFDFATTSAVSANIRALEGGIVGNVGANSIDSQPAPVSGVDTTTNLYATGDPTNVDLNNEPFRVGEDEETDRELRDRAESSVTGGGAATHDAIVAALVNDIEDVSSVSLYENKTDTDNTGSGGLPPHSFEAVVFGGTDQQVAETIFETKASTSRDYGGANGTATTVTVQSSLTGDTRDISFSRPTEVSVDITLDVVINDNYIGDEALRNRIVRYVGGTLADGGDTVGLGVEEDVIIDALTDVVVGAEETGVKALDQSVDGSPIETTPSITTVDGIRVVDIGANEVATTDATDGSITINTRQQ